MTLVPFMLPLVVLDVLEYLDAAGRSPVKRLFDRLDANASAKVTFAITGMIQGNLSNAKAVGGGVFEFKIDFGPGYRLYFGRDGERVVILLGGGTKKRQQRDIEAAIEN